MDDTRTRIRNGNGYKVLLNLWISAYGFIDTRFRFLEKLLRRLKQSGLQLPGM